MGRLTYKNGFGKYAILLNGQEITGNIAEKLAQYENLGDPENLAPVVRCKDCKYYDQYPIECTEGECRLRGKSLVLYDCFCSSAERKVTQ